MKKTLYMGFITLFFFNLAAGDGFCQKAEEILAKMITAQGGKKNLENIETSTFTGSLEMTATKLKGNISIYWKKPNKRRVDVEIMGMKIIQSYDGQMAWMDNPQMGGVMKMEEKSAGDFKRQSIAYEAYCNPKKYGITYTFKGKEKIKNRDCLVLEQSYPDGHLVTLYVDAENYLITKMRTSSSNRMGGEVENETYFSHYKKVGNIVIPHSYIIFQSKQEYLKITFEKVDFNVTINDSLFQMKK